MNSGATIHHLSVFAVILHILGEAKYLFLDVNNIGYTLSQRL